MLGALRVEGLTVTEYTEPHLEMICRSSIKEKES